MKMLSSTQFIKRQTLSFLAMLAATFCVANPGCCAQAQDVPKAWNANWIASPDGPARDYSVVYFRKSLALDQVPQKFLVDVSADTRFELHVNGKRVGNGPALSDVHHWHYETFDLAPYLQAGKNQIAAIVWNFGTAAAVAQMSSRTAFLISAEDPANAAINTGAGWQTSIEEGRALAANPQGEYYAAGPAELLDGRKFNWSWDSAEDGSAKWSDAMLIGHAAVRGVQDSPTPWMLIKDNLPPMSYSPTSAGKVVKVSGLNAKVDSLETPVVIPAHSEATILLDRGALTTAFLSLETNGGKDASIFLTYSEALYDAHNHKGNRNEIEGRHIAGLRDQIFTDGGQRSYRTLWWRTWRYLQLEIKTDAQPLTVQKLQGIYTAYPFSAAGHFESDDPQLEQIWKTGWLTAQLCAHETYMDTPYWEQLQYIGDTRIQSLISYGVTGDDRLARQAMEAYRNSLMPEGLTTSRYPSSLTQIIPPFSLLWVGMLHDYWMYRDDRAFVALLLPGTRGVLDWFEARQRHDGLLGPIEWWPFVDWSPPDFDGGVPPQEADGGSSALTLQFIEALQYAAAMEDQFGEKDRARQYREWERRASDGLRGLSWDEKAGLLADTPAKNHFSQQANSLAVWLDVIPKDKQKAVMEKVLAVSPDSAGSAASGSEAGKTPMSPASYYFRFYVAKAMVHAGLGDQYAPQLEPWRKMLQLGLSTWAENPEPTRSDSHAWSAHPTFDLMAVVAGIGPGSPGFGTVTIEPHLGTLQHVAASMLTPHGLVEVSYMKDSAGWGAQITLPETLSGTLIWQGRSFSLHPGTQKLRLDL
jgi:hypothetical protein